MSNCLHCDKPIEARGLCHGCYQAAWRYVRLDRSTWEQLEAEGHVLKVKHHTNKGTFLKVVEERKQQRVDSLPDLSKQFPPVTPTKTQTVNSELKERQPLETEIRHPFGFNSFPEQKKPWPDPLAGAPPAQGDYEPVDPDSQAPTGCEPPEETPAPPMTPPDPVSEPLELKETKQGLSYPVSRPIPDFFHDKPDLQSGQQYSTPSDPWLKK